MFSGQCQHALAHRNGESPGVSEGRVVVVGAGMAGLVAALLLASRGVPVTLLERAAGPGGKLRTATVAGRAIDAGPTVLTLRPVLEEIFAEAGASLAAAVTLRPAELLARHAWSERQRLDLFADRQRSAEAIGAFAGAGEARGYLRFCADAGRIFRTLEHGFIRAAKPSLPGLIGGTALGELRRIRPFTTLWAALGDYFADPRLRQLFGRYATYCGSSPFLAPATLMLVAHVEQEGVWLVEGGMHRLATALADLAAARGAELRYGAEVEAILVQSGRACGVRLAGGEQLAADALVLNADVAALAAGRLGRAAAPAVAAPPPARRSLSAVTWTLVAQAKGFPLVRHNVFFSGDYAGEFEDILRRARLPAAPTVYVCAQDRDDQGALAPAEERLLCLVNAPAIGDRHAFPAAEIEPCARRTFAFLERCGLSLEHPPQACTVTTPADFEQLFPATGSALRPGLARLEGLVRAPLGAHPPAGALSRRGSCHPGPGLPMAALSGRMAATCLLADRASTRR